MTAAVLAPASPRRVVVTRAELAVLHELLRDGASNAAIGARLHNAEDTVKSHVKALLRKTGTTSRSELIVAVMRDHVVVQGPVGALPRSGGVA